LLRINDEIQNQPSNHTDEQISNTATVIVLSIEKIRMFSKHPFHLYEGERLDDMVESVKANGVLIPAIVRKIEPDGSGCEYEMLSGHNRLNASRLAGRNEIPCIVKENLSDEDAWIYVVETNVLQRSFADMLPSEKAAVLALRYSKMFSQGKRNDIIAELKALENPQYIEEKSTYGHDVHKSISRDTVGFEYGLNGRSVARYLRVDKLILPLKQRLDNSEITLISSVGLSYLAESEQKILEKVLDENEYKITPKKVSLLREYSGRLNQEIATQILSGEKNRKPKNSTPPPVKIKYKTYSQYFSANTKPSEMEQVIEEALREYFVHHPRIAGSEGKDNVAIS
jgi:ParB family transcriptional regulator, chromosome partitioning protein